MIPSTTFQFHSAKSIRKFIISHYHENKVNYVYFFHRVQSLSFVFFSFVIIRFNNRLPSCRRFHCFTAGDSIFNFPLLNPVNELWVFLSLFKRYVCFYLVFFTGAQCHQSYYYFLNKTSPPITDIPDQRNKVSLQERIIF